MDRRMLGCSVQTLNLSTLSPSDQIIVKLGDAEECVLDFVITKPAEEKSVKTNDCACALLPEWKWRGIKKGSGTEKIEVTIVGSYTYRRETLLNDTVKPGTIVVGKNIVLIKNDGSDERLVFKTPIQKITVQKTN